MISALKSAEAENAVRRVRDFEAWGRQAGEGSHRRRKGRERTAEDALAKAEAELKALERSLENASPEKIAEAEAGGGGGEGRLRRRSKPRRRYWRLRGRRRKAKADAVSETQAEIKAADIVMAAAIRRPLKWRNIICSRCRC